MHRVIQFILLLLLFNNVASIKEEFIPILDMGIAPSVMSVELSSTQHLSDDSFLSSPASPSLPVAELLSNSITINGRSLSRPGRNFLNGYFFYVSNFYKRMMNFKEYSLSLFEKSFLFVSVHRILPACRYYVFTLRHIII